MPTVANSRPMLKEQAASLTTDEDFLLEQQQTLSRECAESVLTRYHSYITYLSIKLNLTTYFFFTKTGFFRQNKRVYFSTLHFDEIFILQFEIFRTNYKKKKKLKKL